MASSRALAVQPEKVIRLYNRFRKLDREKHGILTKQELMMVPELAMNPLADRIVAAALTEADGGEGINFPHFLGILACFHVSNGKSLQLLFRVFDGDGDGKVTMKDLRSTIRLVVGEPPSDKEVSAAKEAGPGQAAKKARVAATDEEVDTLVKSTAEALGLRGDGAGLGEEAFVEYARTSGLEGLMRFAPKDDEDDE